jgi:hypothetical protein
LGLSDLYDTLVMLEGMPDRCIIRGAPLFGEDEWTYRRMRSERATAARKDGIEPSFEARDLAWLCLDLDDVPRPEGFDDMRPLRHVDALVPRAFRGCGLVWQWSNGARYGAAIRAHIWYLLDREVCDGSVRDWLAAQEVADLSLYNPVQIHYTAAPLFVGMPEAIRVRLLMRDGPPVQLPDEVVDLWTMRKTAAAYAAADVRKRKLAARHTSLAKRSKDETSYARGALRRACQSIIQAGEGGRHSQLVAEATATWGFVLAGKLDEATWESAIRGAAGQTIPQERVNGGEIDAALEWARTHGEERT